MGISGIVQSIIFRNEQNGYTVLDVYTRDSGDETVVGTMPLLSAGDRAVFTGDYAEHTEYGVQFRAVSCRVELPDSLTEIERYLASGQIKGVGPSTAKLIVHRFGRETFDVLAGDPERLRQVPGIGKKRAEMIVASFTEANNSRNIMMFLQRFDISALQAGRIFKAYGTNTIDRVKADPYRLIYDVPGFGFHAADRIAETVGVSPEAASRVRAGVTYVMKSAAAAAGHMYLPRSVLEEDAIALLGVDAQRVAETINDMVIAGQLIARTLEGGGTAVYLPYYHAVEGETAQRLVGLSLSFTGGKTACAEQDVADFEGEHGIAFAPAQRQAVLDSLENGVCVITGGPGTGKTTILNCLIYVFERRGVSYELCAPTGRAAKRMSDATGREARTIHRLLEYSAESGDEPVFGHDEDEPLDADAVVVDEMSMVDMVLMRALTRAVKPGARLIMVGDPDQLMSVGAGDVLRDIIRSDRLAVARLTEIFRQSAGSAIIANAHRINHGQALVYNEKGGDFFLERRASASATADSVIALVKTRLPGHFGFDRLREIQVLSPMKKGETGVIALNQRLRDELNPPSAKKRECVFGTLRLREGDKVMQVRNNYQMEWTRTDGSGEEGMGVYNGDIGFVEDIDTDAGRVCVVFDDSRRAEYELGQLDELDLAYALTVHKSQGSEFRAVVLPLFSGAGMLMTRNLLYTAVTRAKELVIITGREQTVNSMVANDHVSVRYSLLAQRMAALADMAAKAQG